MPYTIIELQNLFNTARERNPNANIPEFNPLDPMCAMIGVLLKLAQEVQFGNDKRFGWRVDDKNDPKARSNSLLAWNPLGEEKEYILKRDISYRQSFPQVITEGTI